MSIFSSYKKIFLLGFIVVILIAIPFSVFIAQQRQNINSQAATSTDLSFEPASSTIKVGDIVTLNIVLNPGAKAPKNLISFVKLSISFSASKFTAISLEPNKDGVNTLINPIDEAQLESGKATLSLSIGADPAQAVTTKTKIAILKLKAVDQDNGVTPTVPNVRFDPDPDTQVLSVADADGTSENVLSTANPATIIIQGANPAPTISPTTTPTGSPTPTSSPTPTPTAAPGNVQQPVQNPIVFVTPTPLVFQPTPTIVIFSPEITLPPTGPGENILKVGILGAVFTIIGGVLLILL